MLVIDCLYLFQIKSCLPIFCHGSCSVPSSWITKRFILRAWPLDAPTAQEVKTSTDDLYFTSKWMPKSPNDKTSRCSASCVRWQRGTARIRPPLLLSAGSVAIDRYLLPAGPTAANLQQRVCCCGPCWDIQTDGRTDGQTYRRTNSVPFYRPYSADWAYAGTAIKQKLKNRIAEQTKNDTGWLINSYYLHESLLKIYRTFSSNTPRVKEPVETRS